MSLVSWFGFLANMAAAGGFTVVCALYAKRIGGVGPWLVASVGAVDVLLILMFRAHAMMGRDPESSFADYERDMLLLESIDAMMTFTSAILALIGFALMMPKTRRG